MHKQIQQQGEFPGLPVHPGSRDLRLSIVTEALTWLGTPWHHAARVKGAGVDCGQFLIACYRAAGAIEEPTIAPYPRDWNLNRDEPRFLNALLEYCVTTDTPQAGDIAMFKYGRHAAHGAIYLEDERIIHAWLDQGGVVITDLTSCGIASRLAGYYTLKERA